MKNIVLIGFMGTGKTSTGKMLARRLGRRLVDTDKLIEEQAGTSISNIFAGHGEEYFRNLETETVRELSGRKNMVIATGGGIVKRAENIELLRKNGVIICLTASVSCVLERTGTKGVRPVLDKEDQGDRRQAIEKLMNERKKLYEQADICFDTEESTPMESAEKIIGLLKIRGEL